MSDTTRNTIVALVFILAILTAIAVAVWMPQTASAQEITFPSPLVTPEPVRYTFNKVWLPLIERGYSRE